MTKAAKREKRLMKWIFLYTNSRLSSVEGGSQKLLKVGRIICAPDLEPRHRIEVGHI